MIGLTVPLRHQIDTELGKMRRTYIFRDGKLIEVERVAAQPRVYIIGDDLGAELRHPSTGKYYSSRSRFMEETRQAGGYCVGNDFADMTKLIKERDAWADKKVDVSKHFDLAERSLKYKNDLV